MPIIFDTFLVIFVIAATPAHAYIDPSGGHIIWQLLMSLFAGGVVSVRRLWRGKKTTTLPPASESAEKKKATGS